MPRDTLNIFIGYDSREAEAYDVCAHSILRRATIPVNINPISHEHDLHKRKEFIRDGVRYDALDGKPFTTDFSFARFLVPAIMKNEGWALFADCDFLFLTDVAELCKYMTVGHAVSVVMHNHVPKETLKWGEQPQTQYRRKNWSSLMLWNCWHKANRALTPEVVNSETGSWLHGLEWIRTTQIGALPLEWNYLAGYYDTVNPDTLKAIHYTNGGPWFPEYRDTPYADLWFAEREHMQRNAGLKIHERHAG